MNDSIMSPRSLLRLLPQAGWCALTSPIKSSGAWIWLTKSSSSLSVGWGAVGDMYKEIAHTWVCPILSLTATQFNGVLRVTLLCGTLLAMRMAAPPRLFCSFTLCVCQVYPVIRFHWSESLKWVSWSAAMTGVVRTISPLNSGHFLISPHVFHCKMFIYVLYCGSCGLCISSSWIGKCFLDLGRWGFLAFGYGGLAAEEVGFQGLGVGVRSRG